MYVDKSDYYLFSHSPTFFTYIQLLTYSKSYLHDYLFSVDVQCTLWKLQKFTLIETRFKILLKSLTTRYLFAYLRI